MTIDTARPRIDARVVRDAYGFRVIPKDVFKNAGNEFTFLNRTASTVHVIFPETLPMTPQDASIDPGKYKTFVISDKADAGLYEYQVKVVGVTERDVEFTLLASGGSDPNIIIDFSAAG